jgi:hypothetical protein
MDTMQFRTERLWAGWRVARCVGVRQVRVRGLMIRLQIRILGHLYGGDSAGEAGRLGNQETGHYGTGEAEIRKLCNWKLECGEQWAAPGETGLDSRLRRAGMTSRFMWSTV